MRNLLFRKSFEQKERMRLPPKATRILHSVAQDFLASNRTAKRHEIAHATLHMRLYQQFGRHSSDIVSEADDLLHKLVGPKATQ
jgi:hypothetical protein